MLLMLIPNHLLESSIKELNSLPYKQLEPVSTLFLYSGGSSSAGPALVEITAARSLYSKGAL